MRRMMDYFQAVVFALAFTGTLLIVVVVVVIVERGGVETHRQRYNSWWKGMSGGPRHDVLGGSIDSSSVVFRPRIQTEGQNGRRRARLSCWIVSFFAFNAILSFLCLGWLILGGGRPCTLSTCCSSNSQRLAASSSRSQSSPAAPQEDLMNVFQVYHPPASPPTPPSKYSNICEIQLMNHIFAFSYGAPFVGTYTPPPCPFNSVTMTLTVTSRGRQFDRLALMFLGDIEVFRTSTAEPTADGIRWSYTKDMTPYLSLWRQRQKVVFDLGNLVDDMYTGTFNATLTATFFEVQKPPQSADLILPISSQRSRWGFRARSVYQLIMLRLVRGCQQILGR